MSAPCAEQLTTLLLTFSPPAGNEKALATVTAIIDGMGSIGAAIGPMLTGYISGEGVAGALAGWLGLGLGEGLRGCGCH